MSPAQRAQRKLKWLWIVVLCAILIQVSPVWGLKEKIQNGRSDFSAFFTAGRILDTGQGSQLYDMEVQRQQQRIFPSKDGRPQLLPYNHPPFEALLFAPLCWSNSYVAAFALWLGCNLAMSIGVMFLLRPHLGALGNYFDFALIAISFFLPLLVAIVQGQDSILVLFLFALCYVALVQQRHWLAGAMLALAMIKPQLALPVLLVLAVAHKPRRRFFAGFLCVALALLVLSVAAVGWRALAGYPAVLLHSVPENPGVIKPESMPNVRGLLYWLLKPHLTIPLLHWIIVAVSAILLCAAAMSWRLSDRREELFQLKFALALTATVLVAFHGNMHDSTVLILPMLFSCNWLLQKGVNTLNRAWLAASLAALGPTSWSSEPILCCATLALFWGIVFELLQNRVGKNNSAVSQQPLSQRANCGLVGAPRLRNSGITAAALISQ